MTTIASPSSSRDVALLNHALDVEHMAIAAYSAGIPLLSSTTQKAAQQFLAQEVSHAGELAGLVKQAGGKPRVPQASYNLGNPRTAADVLALLHDLERAQITAYLQAIPRLSAGPVRSAVSTLVANDAQHIALIRGAAGTNPVPGAFVTAGQ